MRIKKTKKTNYRADPDLISYIEKGYTPTKKELLKGILGLFLILLPFIGMLLYLFILDWKETLFISGVIWIMALCVGTGAWLLDIPNRDDFRELPIEEMGVPKKK